MIYGSSQKQALFLWFGLPHFFMWISFFVASMLLAYSSYFVTLNPALPLMIALLWSWEWRSGGISISLFVIGLCADLLSGTPFGFHGFLWVGAYLLLPFTTHGFSEDTPFASRLLPCLIVLAIYLLAESVLASMYELATPSLFSNILRWLVMVCFMPLISWSIYRFKSTLYKKLWARLPEELRVGIR